MLSRPLRHLLGLIALVIALVIAIGGPVGFVIDQRLTEHAILSFKARLTADRVARYVYVHPNMWQYQGLRIAETLVLPRADAVHLTVLDESGATVLEQGPTARMPTMTVDVPIMVAEREVGRVVLVASLRAMMMQAGMVTIVCWVLAAAVFLVVRGVPLRALDRTMAELAREQARFGLALDNMGQGLCMLDADGRVVVVSRRMIEMFALPDRDRLIGMTAAAFAQALVDRLGAPTGLERWFLPGSTEAPARIDLPDGRVIAVSRRSTPERLLVVTCDDVTAQAHAQFAEADRAAALAEARILREREHVAQETSKAKSLFLATMSHEIRTPMNAVLGLASSLLDSDLTEEQRHAVSTIHHSGDILLRLLNDILDYSKLEAGKLVFEEVAFAPATLAEGARSILGPRAAERGIAFHVVSGPDLPPAVLGDVARLRQVLFNLVSNAVKFTSQGSVTVSVDCTRVDDDHVLARWRVRDTGIGIAADKIGALFTEFVQADGSINRRFGGSGLGLAISRRLIEAMGGTISVESTPGAGSVFSFEVRLRVAEAQADAAATAVPDAAAALRAFIADQDRSLRVLVAEDNLTNQFVIRQMLKGLDIRLDMAANGSEAIAAADRAAYDAILMDMQMPEVDGLAATRAIRARGGALATVPIIALTGNAFDDDIRACETAGMDAFLSKPVNKALLLMTLLRQCARAPSRPAPELAIADGSS